jgi:hypothetical protein
MPYVQEVYCSPSPRPVWALNGNPPAYRIPQPIVCQVPMSFRGVGCPFLCVAVIAFTVFSQRRLHFLCVNFQLQAVLLLTEINVGICIAPTRVTGRL